jgi:hypothetical protein
MQRDLRLLGQVAGPQVHFHRLGLTTFIEYRTQDRNVAQPSFVATQSSFHFRFQCHAKIWPAATHYKKPRE